MFNFLINTMEHLDPSHHVIAGVFIPALAAITIFVMVNVANRLSKFFQSPIIHNPVWVALIYVVLLAAYFLHPFGRWLPLWPILDILLAFVLIYPVAKISKDVFGERLNVKRLPVSLVFV
jgi:hypothetical protein